MSDESDTMGDVEVAPPPPAPRVVTRRVEEWAKIKRTPAVTVKAAARFARWEIGEQVDPWMVDEASYDAAVAVAENPYLAANPPKKTEP